MKIKIRALKVIQLFKSIWHQIKTYPISLVLFVAAATCLALSPSDVWSKLVNSLDLGGLGFVIRDIEDKSSKKNKLHQQTLPYLRRIR